MRITYRSFVRLHYMNLRVKSWIPHPYEKKQVYMCENEFLKLSRELTCLYRMIRKRLDSITQKKEPSIICIRDMMSGFIATHPIICHMGVKVDSVRNMILKLYDEPFLDDYKPKIQTCEKHEYVTEMCSFCNHGYMEYDYINGHASCSSCGYIDQSFHLSLRKDNFDFSSNPDETNRKHTGGYIHSKYEGVGYMEDLQQWNQFTNYTSDFLKRMDICLQNRRDLYHTNKNERIAAMLLLPLIINQIPDEQDVREKIQRGNQITTEFKDCRPQPTFECKTCGTFLFSHKCARFHCRS